MFKKITAICMFALIAHSSALAAEKIEPGVFDTAIKQSQESNKPLLFLYTGSTWCGPCMRFEKNVLNTDEWKNFAKEKITFLIIDIKGGNILNLYLNGKSIKGEGDALKAQEKEVHHFTSYTYEINYVPALMIYNPKTKKWKTIDRADNPAGFIKILEGEWAVQ